MGAIGGQSAGRLIGSYNGITNGLAEGAHEGTAAGLSADDVEVSIGNKVQAIGKLEVLSASVVIHKELEIGKKYQALIAYYGDLIFTVDLHEAIITQDPENGSRYDVVLPLPKSEVFIDDTKSQKLASDLAHAWSGSDQGGYQAGIDNDNNVKKHAEKYIDNYAELSDNARMSAKKQIEFFIQSATEKEVSINVSFKEDGTE